MPRPTRIRIGPLDYRVEWVGDEWRRATDCAGQCDPKIGVISIPENLATPAETACVFAHEVMHGILHWTEIDKQLTLENVCNMASYGMVDFWRDNPDAFAWWAGLVEGGMA